MSEPRPGDGPVRPSGWHGPPPGGPAPTDPPAWGGPNPRPTTWGPAPASPGQPLQPAHLPPSGYGPPAQYWPPAQQIPGGPGWGAPVPPRPPALPVVEREYQEFWRTPGIPMWKLFVLVILGAVGFFAISLVITLAAVVIDGLLTPGGFTEVSNDLLAGEVSRLVFVANSVALGLMIPLAFLLQRYTRQPAGFLSSVVGRIRWGWLLTCFGISLLAVGVLTAIELGLGGWASLGLEPGPGWLPLLAAILVVTPFQAAGEEYLIRGLVFRAAGSLVPHRWLALGLGASVSSFVFMLLHGAADPWLNLTYFCMGLLFCYLTWRTGGLEAAIAMHAANNLVGLAFVPFQEWGGIFDRSAGVAGPVVLIQLVLLLAAAAVIEVAARRRAMVNTAAPAARPVMPGGQRWA